MNLENVYAVVMAGGKGERFWPQSRSSHPKQLLRLIGNLTMLEQTVARLTSAGIAPQNCLVITNREYELPMRSLLSSIPAENIIGEATGRDTAACVAVAAGIAAARCKATDSVLVATPADHIIHDAKQFKQVLNDAVQAAVMYKKAVTIGIKPRFATTGYGYLRCGEAIDPGLPTAFRRGEGFVEKPSLEEATKFLASGNYRWNSGIFVWTLPVLREELQCYAPSLSELAETVKAAIGCGTLNEVLALEYPHFDRISIDYALMEKLRDVLVAEATFDWDDVGSWTELRNQVKPDRNNNVVRGLFAGLGAKDCIIVGDNNHLITAVDVDDLIIVHTEDATLVCNGKSAQRVKNLVQMLGDNPELRKFL